MFFKHKKKKQSRTNYVEVGSPQLDNLIFCLSKPINKKNIVIFDHNNWRLHQYNNEPIYMMPILLTNQINLMMVFSPCILHQQWGVTICPALVNADHEVVGFAPDKVITTGRGINFIGQYNATKANGLLSYFATLRTLNKGSWKKISA